MRNSGRWIASLVLVVAVATVGAPGNGVPQSPPQTGETPRLVQASDEMTAMFAARRQGSRVEVVAERTETRTVFANPDGTHTAEISAVPTRVKRGDEWRPIDTSLEAGPGGSIVPKAALGDVVLSGGGADTPLIRMRSGNAELALRWPDALPAPMVTGNSAAYREVLPGVDLVMRAELRGYQQLLVVKTPEAARNPALVRMGMPVETRDLRLTADESGSLRAVDAGGLPVFESPPSMMWDSSSTGASRSAAVGVEVAGNVLTLVPDQKFLADPATVYPVMIDPTTQPAGTMAWSNPVSGNPGTAYWNRSAAPDTPGWAQVGQCYREVPDRCLGMGEAQAYFRFSTGFLQDKELVAATFFTKVMHSPASATHTHQLHVVHHNQGISPSTTWNSRPPTTKWTDFDAPAARTGIGSVELNVKGALNGLGDTTFSLRAADPNLQVAWRKYDPPQTWIQVTWNRAPNTPTNLHTDPPLPQACRWCEGKPFIGDAGIRFIATLSDPDNDRIYPKWWTKIGGGGPTLETGDFADSGVPRGKDLDLTGLHDMEVEWAVQAHDGVAESAPSGMGPFVVDRVAPGVRPTISSALYKKDSWQGGAGVPGEFTFGANGVDDIDHYLYGLQDPPSTEVSANALGGEATVTVWPPGDGPRDLYVQSVDRAGHRSQTEVYHFYVRGGNGPLAHWSLEGKPNDGAFLGNRHGTLNGNASYSTGAVGTAVKLDGNAGSTISLPKAFPADSSFSVSAWVRPDEAGSRSMTPLSQDGENTSAWWLDYSSDLKAWSFLVSGYNRGESNLQVYRAVNQNAGPAVGEWTHLTGVFDRQANEIRLYVNGFLASEVAVVPNFTPQRTTGAIFAGRVQWNGGIGNEWLGSIDEIQAYDRALSDTEVGALVSRDNVRTGHWKLDDEPMVGEAPNKTARNAVIDGADGTLSRGATLVANGSLGGAVQLDGLEGHVTTGKPVVRTDRSFTVSAWVTPKAFPSSGGSMTAVSQDGTANSGFYLQYNGSGSYLFMKAGTDRTDNTQWVGAGGGAKPEVGKPAHLTGVYDASTMELSLYVNGQRGGTVKAAQPAWNATGPLVIGRAKLVGSTADFWNGQIDDVRTFNRVLTAEEIQALVSQSDVPAASWTLDGNTNDSSPGNKHGTVVGSAEWIPGQAKDPDDNDKAVKLKGSSAISAPSTISTTESYSVAAWVKLDDPANCYCSVVSQDAQFSHALSIGVTQGVDPLNSQRKIGRWVLFGTAGDREKDNPVGEWIIWGEVQPGMWAHVAAVHNKQLQRLELYVNGVMIAQRTFTNPIHSAGALQIGRAMWWQNPSSNRYSNYLAGAIDDVKVYPRALFGDEIRVMAGRDLSLVHNWQLNEDSGAGTPDSVGNRSGTLTGNATIQPGRAGNAVKLNGTNSVVSTTGVDLRTDQNFTVSAWVNLAQPEPCADVCTRSAVSLDGGQGRPSSKFRLGHRNDQDQARGRGKWIFEMPEENGTPTRAAISVRQGQFDKWVLLVGAYDALTGKIELYVYDVPGAEPDHESGRLERPWHATGGLQIGRGRAAGAAGEYWRGAVDDVRLYTGSLNADRLTALYKSYPVVTGS
ncbi:hypothetical protein JOF56_011046 [Kibdelosporangium banguiense]|uniref:LamG-like jellyroll fold domain-containing protein n=1 Tax=Kibdelosporangium banguiense TaxID=1365924 RepID=A0ABS4U212_9PSEU|nr:LamG domain-containing protein [Kibdelosporangium banguiense]MBP2330661.1 hypothetical protein [Kibdelosporangium banguiense]